MKIKPLADRVVLKAYAAEEKTKSGIILTSSNNEMPSIYEVIEVGPGGMVDGEKVVMNLKVGDKVITSMYGSVKVKLDGVEYLVIKESDVIAVVE